MTPTEATKLLEKLFLMADFTDEYGDMCNSEPYEEAVNMANKDLEEVDYVCERCKYVERSVHEFPCNECVHAYENHFTEVKEADND